MGVSAESFQPPTFDFGLAEGVVAAANSASAALIGQAESRLRLAAGGSEGFSGYFAEVFAANAAIAYSDAAELGTRIREVPRFME